MEKNVKILNGHELYEVCLNNKEISSCRAFVRWIFDMTFLERFQFLTDMEKECFTYDSWMDFVKNNWFEK